MNKQEAIDIIKEEVLVKGNNPAYDADFSKLEAAGFKISTAEREGGEGEGSLYHVILELEKDNEKTFVKCDGYYASYEGTSWGDGEVYEVTKKKVEVEQWVKS